MYEKFFYLKENPFNITPDPKFLYLSKKHQEALDLLYFGVAQRKGFLMLSGEVGTGKTTLCRALLDKLNSKVQSAFIINPLLSDVELIKTINEDFGLRVDGSSLKEQVDALNSFLLKRAEENKNAVVIIDEAQNMSLKALEMVRLLSNLETEKIKLLQIILIGQPELREKIKLPELRQLNQRIVVRYHLGSLNFEETKTYIFMRLTVAGGKGNIKFTSAALKSIYEASSGIPRLINIICDRALTAAFVVGKRVIDEEIEKRAVDELDKDGTLRQDVNIKPRRGRHRYRYLPYLSAAAVPVIAIAALWFNDKKAAVVPPIEVAPTIKSLSENAHPSSSIAADVAVQSSLPHEDMKIQNTAVAQIESHAQDQPKSEKNVEPEDKKEVSALSDKQDSVQASNGVVVFKGLRILLNGNEYTMSGNETVEIAKGDKIKIIDAIIDGASSKDVSVNFLGFIGNKYSNKGEDRGYLIDTSKDLWVKYSVKKKGIEYPIVVKYGDKKIGEVFIKIKQSDNPKNSD